MDFTLINIVVLIVILLICYFIHLTIITRVRDGYDNLIRMIEYADSKRFEIMNRTIEDLVHDSLLMQKKIKKYKRLIDNYKLSIENDKFIIENLK